MIRVSSSALKYTSIRRSDRIRWMHALQSYSPVRNFGPHPHKTYFSSIKHSFLTKARLSPQITRIHPILGSRFEDISQTLSTEKLARIWASLEMGTYQKTIAQWAGISKRQVTRIKHNIVFYGSVKRPKKPLQGRQPKITEGMAEVCVVLSEKVADFR